MSNLRIIYDNAADRAVLTASSQVGELGVANLKTDEKCEILRAAGTALTITATLPIGEIVGGVALPFCNLSAAATIRVRAYAEPGDAAPVVDTGAVLACAYSPLGAFAWGATRLAVNAFSYGGGTYARAWFNRTTARHFIIDLDDPNNRAGQIEVARLVMGNYWSPENNASYGAGVTPVDTSEQYRTAGNSQQVSRGAQYRKLAFPLDCMTPIDRANLWRIVRGNGLSQPVFISLLPDNADPELEQAHQVYGRLSSLAAITIPRFEAYATTFDIEEL